MNSMPPKLFSSYACFEIVDKFTNFSEIRCFHPQSRDNCNEKCK